MILSLCERFPAYTPDTARMADVSVLRMVELAAMGRIENPEPVNRDIAAE